MAISASLIPKSRSLSLTIRLREISGYFSKNSFICVVSQTEPNAIVVVTLREPWGSSLLTVKEFSAEDI